MKKHETVSYGCGLKALKKHGLGPMQEKIHQGDYTMFTQQIAKPSYVKTKAFGLCGTLALATALLIGAGSVSADETANLAPVSKETPKTAVYGGVLPNTGEKEGIASTLGLVVIAASITALTLGFKKFNEGEK